jgi:DNA-binding response OmpR family regulator
MLEGMRKVLAIEDDADVYRLLQYNLEKDGFLFRGTQAGTGAVDLCRAERPDLILLDVMLPGVTGMEICRQLRATPECAQTPILFLTARAREEDRVLGLEIGANDYIVKPFFVRELLTRVRAHLRPRVKEGKPLLAGDLELDRLSCRVKRKGREIPVTATEFKLLEFFLAHPNRVHSREQLLDAVWGHGHAVTDRTVDVYVLRLRQKLDPDGEMLRSVRGYGYSLAS